MRQMTVVSRGRWANQVLRNNVSWKMERENRRERDDCRNLRAEELSR